MQQKITSLFIATVFFSNSLFAQSFAVNTDGSTANASSLLDVKSTTKGLLIPRMSKTQKNAIASPATGLLVFQNAPDSIGFHYYDGAVWTWLANSSTPDDWKIGGNNNIGVSNYLGTTNNSDLRMGVNGFECSRFSASSGFMGIGEFAPQYGLDVTFGTYNVNPCTRNGIRLKSTSLGNDCDRGLFLGYDNFGSTATASLWNYSNGSNQAQNIRFGLNTTEISRFTSNGFFGLGESNPQYTMDVKLGVAAVNPCTRNGIRMNIPSFVNNCNSGLFIGYDNTTTANSASFWNLGEDGVLPASAILRFGMGDTLLGEKMRITQNAVGIGNTNPFWAKLHVTDNDGLRLPGVMATNGLLGPTERGFYTGLKNNTTTTGMLWNYTLADIEIGIDNIRRMIITAGGNVGIGDNISPSPSSTLTVDGSVAVGVSMGIGGGPIAGPVSLSTSKSYIGLTPSGSNSYYQLPDATGCAGRIYYIRNNSNSDVAHVGSSGGSLICPGSGACLAAGSYYDLNASVSVKTIIAISDGINWTVGKID